MKSFWKQEWDGIRAERKVGHLIELATYTFLIGFLAYVAFDIFWTEGFVDALPVALSFLFLIACGLLDSREVRSLKLYLKAVGAYILNLHEQNNLLKRLDKNNKEIQRLMQQHIDVQDARIELLHKFYTDTVAQMQEKKDPK